ncbi:hypothetical protein TNCT_81441, partial [Trichonephila clavata]
MSLVILVPHGATQRWRDMSYVLHVKKFVDEDLLQEERYAYRPQDWEE